MLRSAWGRIMFNKRVTLLLLLAGSIIVSFLLAEAVARSAVSHGSSGSTEGWGQVWVSDLGQLPSARLRPNNSIIFYGLDVPLEPIEIRINSYGFRDYEYPVSKSRGVKRIIGLGDSQTFGHGVELEQTYLKALERGLAKETEEYEDSVRWEVLNLGVPGYNTRDEVAFFEEKGLRFSPDVVTIYTLNDDVIDHDLVRKSHSVLAAAIDGMRPIEARTNSRIAHLVSASLMELMYRDVDERAVSDWDAVTEPLERLITLGKRTGFIVVVLVHNHSGVYEDMLQLADRGDVALADLSAGLGERGYGSSEMFCLHPKDCHHNATGHAVIASILLENLKREGLLEVSG